MQDAADAHSKFVSLRRETEAERTSAASKVIHLQTAIQELQAQNEAHVARIQQMATSQDTTGMHNTIRLYVYDGEGYPQRYRMMHV